jgi:acyl-CoA thioesterase-1
MYVVLIWVQPLFLISSLIGRSGEKMIAIRKILFTIALVIVGTTAIAEPIEILAIGDSQTNGRGLPDSSSAYPAQLEAMLKADGLEATVKNLGVDGELTYSAYNRMTQNEVSPKTRIVIFQQSGNDAAASASSAVDYSEKALKWLQERKIPAIFISSRRIMQDDAAKALAEKYGAIYHGPLYKKIPKDEEHVQAGEFFLKKQATDYHLTAKGYNVLAAQLKLLVVKIIKDNGL